MSDQLQAAEAELSREKDLLREIETILTYAVIRSPFSGVIIDKQCDVGDMVVPGQVIARLYDPTRMQLVATVRETLARTLRVGDKLHGYIPAIETRSPSLAVRRKTPIACSGIHGLVRIFTKETCWNPSRSERYVAERRS